MDILEVVAMPLAAVWLKENLGSRLSILKLFSDSSWKNMIAGKVQITIELFLHIKVFSNWLTSVLKYGD